MKLSVAIHQLIEKFKLRPKKLFLIDGFGAILSAFLLGVVLVRFERFFGIPIPTLYFLALLPIFFATYDFYCYTVNSDKTSRFLKRIAIINFLYCCLSIGFAFYHTEVITNMGWTYILIEILAVMILALVEFKVARTLTTKNDQ